MLNDDDELLTTEQLAKLRKVPASRLNKERLSGDGPPYIKDRHLVRYRLGDYRVWLASRQRFHSTAQAEVA
jgi:hypothetical protein